MRSLVMVMGLALLSFSCYHDQISTDRNFPKTKTPEQLSQCQLTQSTGCFEGQIAVSPNIRVMDENFFDANDLQQRFFELFAVTSESSGQRLDYGEYIVKLHTKLDNDNFAKGFEIYFKGEFTRKGRVKARGSFSINRLIPGDYEVRVQKPIIFEVVKPAYTKDDNEEVPEETLQTVCATLYQELTLEVIAGQRHRPVFDEFSVITRDIDCGKKSTTNAIAVRL